MLLAPNFARSLSGSCSATPALPASSFRAVRSARSAGAQLQVVCAAAPLKPEPTTSEGVLVVRDDGPAVQSPQLSSEPQAADVQPFKLKLGFTKSFELEFGRLALFGMACSLIAELSTGQGPLALLGLKTGVPSVFEMDPATIFLVGFNVIAALLPASGRFVPDEQLPQRPAGSVESARMSLLTNKETFDAGLTKEQDLLIGRVAQLGLAAALIAEALTGKGTLALMEIETGVPMCDAEPLLIIFIAFNLLVAINPGSGKFVD